MEKTSVKLICIFCLLLFSAAVKGQVIEDANGRPVLVRQYTDVQGSPYLADEWIKGVVTLNNGKTYKAVDLKYDQVADELFFKNAKGETLGFVQPVSEFKLIVLEKETPRVLYFRNGFKPVNGNTEKTFYQILTDDETPLVKRISKKVHENKPYSSATVVKTFEEVREYYLVKYGLPVKIRKDKKSVLAALGSYSDQLDEFIKSNQLNLKDDADLIELVAYYNRLK